MTSDLARHASPSEPDPNRITAPTPDEALAHHRALLEIRRDELSEAFDSTDDPLAQSAMAFELEQVKQELAALGPAPTETTRGQHIAIDQNSTAPNPISSDSASPGSAGELEPIDYHEPADYRFDGEQAELDSGPQAEPPQHEHATRTIDYSRAVVPSEPDGTEDDSWSSPDAETGSAPVTSTPIEPTQGNALIAEINHLDDRLAAELNSADDDGRNGEIHYDVHHVHDFDDAEHFDDVQEFDDVQKFDDVQEFDDVEDFNDVDVLDGQQSFDEFEDVDYADDVEDVNDFEDVDDFDDFDDRAHAFLAAPGPVGDEADGEHPDESEPVGASRYQASVGPQAARTRQQRQQQPRDNNGGRILVVTALFVAALAGMLWLDAGERSSETNSTTLTGIDPASPAFADDAGGEPGADGDVSPDVDPDVQAVLNRIRGVLRSLELLNVVVDYRDGAVHLIGPVPTRSDIDAAVSAARAITGELPLDTSALIVGVPVRAEGLGGQSSDTIAQPGASTVDGPLRVALVAPSAATDWAFTQSMVDAVNVIASERPVELAIADNTVDPADAAVAIRDFAAQGHQLVIVHGSQYGAALLDIADDFPDTAFAWGTSSDTFGLANVYAYHVAADEGGYVFGAMAAMLSRSAVLGVVGPIEVGDAAQYIDGFTAGAKAERPGIDVRVTYTGSYGDIDLAAEAAASHIAAGADVSTGSAQMSVGALATGQEAGIRWFANQADQSPLASDTVVASQVYRWEVVLRPIIEDVDAGRLSGTTQTANLANGGLALAFNPMVSLPPEVRQRADELIAALSDGSLVIAP